GKNANGAMPHSPSKITAVRRLLTWTNSAKDVNLALAPNESSGERFDYGSVTGTYQHLAKIACAARSLRWRSTRNKPASSYLVTAFLNNGHDDCSKRVLAPSFRHDGRSATSASTYASVALGWAWTNAFFTERLPHASGALFLDRPE